MDSGVATRPIEDFAAYRERLSRFVFRSGLVMKPVFEHAKKAPKRIVFAEGDRARVLQAAHQVLTEGIGSPILIGSRRLVEERLAELALPMKPGRDIEVFDPAEDPRVRELAEHYHELGARKGITPADARAVTRRDGTVIAALMLKRGEADAMICGTTGRFEKHLKDIRCIIGQRPGVEVLATMNAMVLPTGAYFFADTQVNYNPSAAEIVEIALLAAKQVRRFGVTPKIALLSHSNFGSARTETAKKMREAAALLSRLEPELEVEGEMRADTALSETVRADLFPKSRLTGEANLLIMPTLDAANIAYNMLKVLGGGTPIGPLLLGADLPAHIATPAATVRGLVNLSALAVVGAGEEEAAAG
jgi:malate dehydrogenase (oxaloacetate-decarboxylating)(NADP+)